MAERCTALDEAVAAFEDAFNTTRGNFRACVEASILAYQTERRVPGSDPVLGEAARELGVPLVLLTALARLDPETRRKVMAAVQPPLCATQT